MDNNYALLPTHIRIHLLTCNNLICCCKLKQHAHTRPSCQPPPQSALPIHPHSPTWERGKTLLYHCILPPFGHSWAPGSILQLLAVNCWVEFREAFQKNHLQLRSCLEQTVLCFSAQSTTNNFARLYPVQEIPDIPLACEDDIDYKHKRWH